MSGASFWWARSSAAAAVIVFPFSLLSICLLSVSFFQNSYGQRPCQFSCVSPWAWHRDSAQEYLLNQRMKTYMLNQRAFSHFMTIEIIMSHKKNEILPFLTTWTDRSLTSAWNKRGKDKYHMISFICGILKKKTKTLSQN